MTTLSKTRERINGEELYNRSRKSKQAAPNTSKNQRLLYACIPAAICQEPKSHDLSPTEIALLGTLISLARIAHAADHYSKAFKFGKVIIDREAEHYNEWRRAWREVKRARKRGGGTHQHRNAFIRTGATATTNPSK